MEIEKKFLLSNDSWKINCSAGVPIKQGYLSDEKSRTVRIRVAGSLGFITVKGETVGISRQEFEYKIPVEDAEYMLNHLCKRPIIEKTRYINGRFEVDVFHGENEGLVVAEIELISEDEVFERPNWLGKEVSDQSRYYNSNLMSNPYELWSNTRLKHE